MLRRGEAVCQLTQKSCFAQCWLWCGGCNLKGFSPTPSAGYVKETSRQNEGASKSTFVILKWGKTTTTHPVGWTAAAPRGKCECVPHLWKHMAFDLTVRSEERRFAERGFLSVPNRHDVTYTYNSCTIYLEWWSIQRMNDLCHFVVWSDMTFQALTHSYIYLFNTKTYHKT